MTEAVGGDQDARAGLAEDEPDFLHAVEVHDRHRHRTEERRRPERRRCLDPVRQLERDEVACADAPGAKPTGDAAGEISDVAERARVRTRPGTDLEGEVGAVGQAGGEDLAQRVVVPRAVGDVAAREVARRGAKLPVRRHVDGPYLGRDFPRPLGLE